MKPTLRKHLFAWLLNHSDSANHAIYGAEKIKLFNNVRGTVVEIGPGSGINFRYLHPSVEWIGIEPNEAFHKRLTEQAQHYGINARCIGGDAARIPLADNSTDTVICTLVLCSVADQHAVLAELKRVLRPNGKLFFIEHVAGRNGSTMRAVQDIFNPLNRLLADGCNCNRETWSAVERAGFSNILLEHRRMKGSFPLHAPHVIGSAQK